MSAPVGPGDFVECVIECHEESPGVQAHWLCGARIEQWRIYTVMRVDVGIDNFGVEVTGFVLMERDTHWPRDDGEFGAWCSLHFRPLYTQRSTFIEDLKQPAERELETVA